MSPEQAPQSESSPKMAKRLDLSENDWIAVKIYIKALIASVCISAFNEISPQSDPAAQDQMEKLAGILLCGAIGTAILHLLGHQYLKRRKEDV